MRRRWGWLFHSFAFYNFILETSEFAGSAVPWNLQSVLALVAGNLLAPGSTYSMMAR